MSETRIVIRERGYFSLPRSAAQDGRLSLETRGLLALMLSLPPDWDYTVTGLAVKAGCGRDKMRRMVRELEAIGYLVREQAHDEGGRFDGNVYVLQETPPLSGNSDNGETAREALPPLDGFSVNGEDINSTVVGKHRQRCEPSTAKPSTGFKAEQIIEEKIIDRNIPPYNPPKGDDADGGSSRPVRQRARRTTPAWKPERFEGFWAYYPRGENRMGAVRAWDKLRPDDALISEIGHALKLLKASQAWQDGVGIPYAATFLNQRRWEDAAAKRPAQRPADRAQPVRRIEQPPDSEDGAWTWTE